MSNMNGNLAMDLKLRTGDAFELHHRAEEVERHEPLGLLLHAMWVTMKAGDERGPGIGLAAPQLGVSKRIIVMNVGTVSQVIINPVITMRSKSKKVISPEGCLSYPGKVVQVPRDAMVVLEGFDDDWEPVKLKLTGIAAMCAQHEVDHLNGTVIGDYEK